MTARNALQAATGPRLPGYLAAIGLPVALTYSTAWFGWPPHVFEHLAILLVVAIAIPCGFGPALAAALVAVGSDNVLLREPIGRPTISGLRDVEDLALFAIVAVVVSGLVARANAARLAAQHAAERERSAREERDRLIATVTHDLGTPLSILSSSVQLFRLQTAVEPDSRFLNRLDTAIRMAASLVRTLSDAQTLDANTMVLDMAARDLRAVVAPVVQMMEGVSSRHQVTLSVPDSPVLVELDPERMQRVVENLLSNAIKYSPDGGPVEVDIGVQDRLAVLRVRDRGIGVSPTSLPHIFDRAFRAPEAAGYAPGLGLGLSIAAQIVARHHGSISAAAADGNGTVLEVRLPLAPGVGTRVSGASQLERRGGRDASVQPQLEAAPEPAAGVSDHIAHMPRPLPSSSNRLGLDSDASRSWNP